MEGATIDTVRPCSEEGVWLAPCGRVLVFFCVGDQPPKKHGMAEVGGTQLVASRQPPSCRHDLAQPIGKEGEICAVPGLCCGGWVTRVQAKSRNAVTNQGTSVARKTRGGKVIDAVSEKKGSTMYRRGWKTGRVCVARGVMRARGG
jgi:hypothetical protein